MKKFTLDPIDLGIRCTAQSSGILRHNIQYWLYIRRRAGDDAKNFARRCLLLQYLGELTFNVLQFIDVRLLAL